MARAMAASRKGSARRCGRRASTTPDPASSYPARSCPRRQDVLARRCSSRSRFDPGCSRCWLALSLTDGRPTPPCLLVGRRLCFFKTRSALLTSLSRTKTCTGFVPFPDMDVARRLRRALAAPRAGQRLDRSPGFSGDLRNLPIQGLDIGLCGQISVDAAEFRARYFAVRGARPVLVENIEENELLAAAKVRTSAHASIPGMLVDVPQTSMDWRGEAERH